MLSTAGMREFRAGVGTIGRRAHVGFRTLGGPPTGSIPLRIAHLHTAAAQARFRTMAVAAAGRNRSQQGRGIREKIERADQENDSQMEESAECGERGKKPIGPAGREYCYPGPVTRWQTSGWESWRRRAFPIKSERGSKLKCECGFGAGTWFLITAKLKII
jgi:hypothetical protein